MKPDDVKALAEPVLAHRLIVAAQGRLRGQDAAAVIADIVARVPVPAEVVQAEGR